MFLYLSFTRVLVTECPLDSTSRSFSSSLSLFLVFSFSFVLVRPPGHYRRRCRCSLCCSLCLFLVRPLGHFHCRCRCSFCFVLVRPSVIFVVVVAVPCVHHCAYYLFDRVRTYVLLLLLSSALQAAYRMRVRTRVELSLIHEVSRPSLHSTFRLFCSH